MARNTANVPTKTTGSTYSASEFETVRGFVDEPSQDLGAFNPGASINIDGSGEYNEHTATGDETWNFANLVDGNTQWLKLTTDGTHTFSAGTNSELWQNTSLGQLDVGTYKIGFAVIFGKVQILGNSSTAPSDTNPPQASFNPASGATDVAVTTDIIITFDEAILNTDGSEVTDANVANLVTLKEDNISGSDITFSATINAGKTIITVSPNSNIAFSQLVFVQVNNFEDAAGNEETTGQSSTFTTASSLTVLNDTFTDTNGTLIADHTPEIGSPGSSESGTHEIQSNKLQAQADLGGNVIWDVGAADTHTTIYISQEDAIGTLFLYSRYTDLNNRIIIDWSSTTIRIDERIGGSSTILDTASLARVITTEYKVEIICNGGSVTVKVDDVEVLSGTTTLLTGNSVGSYINYSTGDNRRDTINDINVDSI